MKKKILFLILAVLLVITFGISASATSVTAKVDNKSCAQGSTVKLNVSLSQSVSVKSGAVTVDYDSSVLELASAEWNTSGALLTHFDTETNLGAFAFSSATNVSGKIFSVTFKVREGAALGDTAVKCDIQLMDALNNSISITNSSGKVSVTCNHSFTVKGTSYPASPATCTSAAKYYYSCSVCGQKGTNTFTEGEPIAHTYDKQIAESKYLVSEAVCVDVADFYYSCQCGATGSATFTADASWSHSYSNEWYINTLEHWHSCTECDARKDSAYHSTDNNETCSVCFFVTSGETIHVHQYGNWHKNDASHWKECDCGEKDALALHAWDDGVVTEEATESSTGKKLFTCSDCAEERTEIIPILSLKDNTENNTNDNTDKPDVTPEGPNTVVIVIITVASVAALELIGFGIYKLSLAKHNQGEHISVQEESDEDGNNEDASNE